MHGRLYGPGPQPQLRVARGADEAQADLSTCLAGAGSAVGGHSNGHGIPCAVIVTHQLASRLKLAVDRVAAAARVT